MEDDTTDVSYDEKDLVEQVLEYLRMNSYVDDCTEAKKRTMNQKESEEVCPSRRSALLQAKEKRRSKLKILDRSLFLPQHACSSNNTRVIHWFAGRFAALYSKQG